ncbi:MAG: methylmalonyl Co-A mutase-associated GTPase MeaB [Bacillota bacterium]|jgi:LAO/AO transport system kinase
MCASSVERDWSGFLNGDTRALARAISLAENDPQAARALLTAVSERLGRAHVIGITGPPGAGKSTLTGSLAQELLRRGHSLGLLLVDPSSPFSGGAILGDRLRLPDLSANKQVFVRSMSSRGSMGGLSRATGDAIKLLDAFGKDIILVETVGTGQAETDVISVADSVVVVSVPGLGDDIQAMKAGILEIADLFVVNKADREGADRTERELLNMLKLQKPSGWKIPVLKTVATSAKGVDALADALADHLRYLQDSGELTSKRVRRAERELTELLKLRVLDALRQQVGLQDLHALAELIVIGQASLYQVSEQLWQSFSQGLTDGSTKQGRRRDYDQEDRPSRCGGKGLGGCG